MSEPASEPADPAEEAGLEPHPAHTDSSRTKARDNAVNFFIMLFSSISFLLFCLTLEFYLIPKRNVLTSGLAEAG